MAEQLVPDEATVESVLADEGVGDASKVLVIYLAQDGLLYALASDNTRDWAKKAAAEFQRRYNAGHWE
jgi:hypothetical protein